MKINFVILAFIIAISSLSAKNNPVFLGGFKEQKNSAIAFTENKGQVHDQNYKARPDVLFSGSDGKMVFHLKNNGISYQLHRIDSYKEEEDLKTKDDALSVSKGKRRVVDQSTIYRVDINWLNANTNATVIRGNTLEGCNNYYLENCPNGALNVKSYEQVEYGNIYTGINLKWYQHHGQLKYDYIVSPHANYKQIKLEIKGAELQIQKNGSLLLKTPLGSIEEHAPIVYQNGKKLKANYVLKGNVLSFNVENYNPNQTLIIDPVIRVWGTYYGGSGADYSRSCTNDASGNVYLAGYTSSNTVMATSGAHQSAHGGGNDAFLVKFNASGVRTWGTYYGGLGNDIGWFCSTDPSGNVYLTGYTNSNTGTVIATSGAHQSAHGGGNDAFLVRFDANGLRQWSTYYGGSGNDEGQSCATDAAGNVYLVGITNTNTGTVIATAGAHQSSHGGAEDAFLVKFNSAGVRQWGTYYGGSAIEYGYACSSDAAGNVYIGGLAQSTTGTVIATIGSHQNTFGGINDAFLAKFNTAGVRQWGTYYGGSTQDWGFACTNDALGNVYLSGWSQSTDGTVIATAGSHQTSMAGIIDAFLVKFDANGVRQWGTYYGGSGQDEGHACSSDASGNVYLGGWTNTNTGTAIATAVAHQNTYGGGTWDAFLVKFNASGVRQWGTYYGGSGTDYSRACTTDAFGNVYLAGYTNSNTGTVIATSVAHQSTQGGSDDAFLVKLTDCVNLSPTATVSSSVCAGASINFTATITGTATPTYTWAGPNSFTAGVQNPVIAGAGTIHIGTYTLTINNSGCLETATTQVSAVNALPTVAVNNGTICSGNSFTINPSGATTYTIEGGNAVVNPTANASYTVIGTSSLGCLSTNTATSNIMVNSLPTVSVNDGTICAGNSLTITPSGASTYTIEGGNAVVNPTANSSYTVVGTSSLGCLSANTATSNITVIALPTVAVNNGTICSGSTFTIIPGGANTYTIEGGSTVVSPTTNASYTVVGTSTAGCVSVSSATSNITVNANPTITAVSNQTLCLGNNFTLTPSGGTSYTVTQGVSLPASFISSIVITPIAGISIYTVTGTNSLSCSGSNTLSTLVNPNPNVTAFTSATNFICVGQSATLTASGANNYTWNPGGIGNSIVINPTVTANYTVTGVDANGCESTAVLSQSVSACSGLNESNYSSLVQIYPNPVNEILNINFASLDLTDLRIEVMNSIGQIVMVSQVNNMITQLDMTSFTSGIYALRVMKDQKQILNHKLIKN
jgi:hypothetical protein